MKRKKNVSTKEIMSNGICHWITDKKKKIDGKNKEEEEGAEEESKISMCHYNKSRLRISVAD